MIRTPAPRRPGFTLVELMVAAAVCVVIMAVLASAFQAGIDTMRQFKSAGEMTDQLRAAGLVMQRDFQANHFTQLDAGVNVLNRGLRLSDYQFNLTGTTTTPRGGFFQIVSPASIYEGNDGSLDSTRADWNQPHKVWFTSVLPGGSEENLYSVAVNNTVYTSEAAEVAYFLSSTGVTANGNSSVPLHYLLRRQKLIATNTTTKTNLQAALDADRYVSAASPGATEVVSATITTSSGNPVATANSMADVASGKRPGFPAQLGGGRYGDDVLLSNVISFEVKPTWSGSPTPRGFGTSSVTLNTSDNPGSSNASSSDYPYDTLAQFSGSVFDTLGTAPGNPKIRVIAIQVRVRVYDPKMKQARQATFVYTP